MNGLKTVFLALCALVCVSCSGVSYNDEIKNIDLAAQNDATCKVLAKADEWRDSGVMIKAGSKYRIMGKGKWTGGTLCGWTGPDGVGASGICGSGLVKGWSVSTLIARIGADGTPFAVGNEHEFTASENGVLYFRINGDGLLKDGDGYMDVKVSLLTPQPKAAQAVPQSEQAKGEKKDEAALKKQESVPLHGPGDKLAVVIGVSSYKDSRIPSLRYAADDAKSFYDWLVSPEGGKYAPKNVKLLLNEDATNQNIKDSLFVWLKQALEEDQVTIYFSGHGSPESPDSPQNLFFLPYDADFANISTSSFPMWDIETALKRFVKAKKVVVITDACHSGGVGQGYEFGRKALPGEESNPINAGIQSLARVGDGIAVITASDDKQFSQESQKWGGGHGVFTYFLLKGLEGDADYKKDGKVTLGSLIPYLSEQVRRETRNAQSPTVAGKFDPALCIGK